MASSATEVVNLALVGLGLEPVGALDETSDRSRAASRWYPTVLDALIRDGNWNFAQTRVALAQLATNPDWGDLFAYQLPTDCLRVLETNLNPDAAWRIEGRTLVTAEPAVSILYLARVTDPTQWDALFLEAIVDALAFRLAYALTRNATLVDALSRISADTRKGAKSRDGQEGRPLKRFLSDAFTRFR